MSKIRDELVRVLEGADTGDGMLSASFEDTADTILASGLLDRALAAKLRELAEDQRARNVVLDELSAWQALRRLADYVETRAADA